MVFFTNQVGIEKLKVKPEEIQQKVEAVISELDIPAYVSMRVTSLRPIFIYQHINIFVLVWGTATTPME